MQKHLKTLSNPLGHTRPKPYKPTTIESKTDSNISSFQPHLTQDGKLSQEIKDHRKKHNLCMVDGGNHPTYQCQRLIEKLAKEGKPPPTPPVQHSVKVGHPVPSIDAPLTIASMSNGKSVELHGEIGGVKARALVDGAAQANASTYNIMNANPTRNIKPIKRKICSFDGNVVVAAELAYESKENNSPYVTSPLPTSPLDKESPSPDTIPHTENEHIVEVFLNTFKQNDAQLENYDIVIPDDLRHLSEASSKSNAAKLPPHHNGIDMTIDIPDGKLPRVVPMSRLSEKEIEEAKKQSDQLIEKGWIRRYIIPAYNMIHIVPGHEWKTAFRTPECCFEWLVMPFGLPNSPPIWQSFIDQVFRDLDDGIISYVEDFLIYAQSKQELHHRTTVVLEKLIQNNLYCFVISEGGLNISPKRIETITEWPIPKNLQQLQQFLGFTNFYRRFISQYSKRCAGMSNLLKKEATQKPFNFDAYALQSFNDIKHSFANSPILQQWDPNLPGILETDASGGGISRILSQRYNGIKRPVAFWSRKIQPEETRYGTPDQELLAVVDALVHFRVYLEGAQHKILI
ncbi:hypothetical protein K3495_g4328 [Podosphaera aphanis]|nr:hypothetical protein K3495_g4328 [Podosphaera aphanis]